MKPTAITASIAAGFVLLLTGCSAGGTEQAAAPTAPAAGGQAPQKMTAGQVLAALKDAEVPLKVTMVFTAETDTNNLLGRPGQYTSKASCSDPRVPKGEIREREKGSIDYGCTVEVFANEAEAKARSAFIQQTLKGLGGFIPPEYHHVRSGVLLRVTGLLTPRQAKVYGTAFDRLPL